MENQFNASGLRDSNSEHPQPDTKSETKSKHAIQVTAHKPMQENDKKKSVSIIETERSGAYRALNDSFDDFESEASDVNMNSTTKNPMDIGGSNGSDNNEGQYSDEYMSVSLDASTKDKDPYHSEPNPRSQNDWKEVTGNNTGTKFKPGQAEDSSGNPSSGLKKKNESDKKMEFQDDTYLEDYYSDETVNSASEQRSGLLTYNDDENDAPASLQKDINSMKNDIKKEIMGIFPMKDVKEENEKSVKREENFIAAEHSSEHLDEHLNVENYNSKSTNSTLENSKIENTALKQSDIKMDDMSATDIMKDSIEENELDQQSKSNPSDNIERGSKIDESFIQIEHKSNHIDSEYSVEEAILKQPLTKPELQNQNSMKQTNSNGAEEFSTTSPNGLKKINESDKKTEFQDILDEQILTNGSSVSQTMQQEKNEFLSKLQNSKQKSQSNIKGSWVNSLGLDPSTNTKSNDKKGDDKKKSVNIIETERSGEYRASNDSFEDFESEASDVNENNLDSTTASTKQQQKKIGNTGFKLSIPKAKKEAFYEKTNRTYRFYDDKKKFLEAQKFCEGFSAKLAMLDNEPKNKFVMAFTDKPFWIGGRQKGQLWTWIASTKTDGSDCPIIHYKPWAEEGLNRFIQGCIEVNGSAEMKPWRERDCNEKKAFVCETIEIKNKPKCDCFC